MITIRHYAFTTKEGLGYMYLKTSDKGTVTGINQFHQTNQVKPDR